MNSDVNDIRPKKDGFSLMGPKFEGLIMWDFLLEPISPVTFDWTVLYAIESQVYLICDPGFVMYETVALWLSFVTFYPLNHGFNNKIYGAYQT